MAKGEKIKKTLVSQATDYLSEVDLGITEKDLSSKPLIKKFLQDLKDAKADNLALTDSLEATQDALEIKKQEYAQLDKDFSVLKAKVKPKQGLETIEDLALVGLGAGLGLLPTSLQIGLGVCLVSAVLYAIAKFYES